MIVGMAVLFTQRAERRDRSTPTSTDVLLALGLVGVPLALILLQPDLGSAMVLAVAAFGVLIAAGAPARWTIGLLALAAVVMGAALHHADPAPDISAQGGIPSDQR